MVVPVGAMGRSVEAPRYWSVWGAEDGAVDSVDTMGSSTDGSSSGGSSGDSGGISGGSGSASHRSASWCDTAARRIWPAHECHQLLLVARVGRRQTTGRKQHGFATFIFTLRETKAIERAGGAGVAYGGASGKMATSGKMAPAAVHNASASFSTPSSSSTSPMGSAELVPWPTALIPARADSNDIGHNLGALWIGQDHRGKGHGKEHGKGHGKGAGKAHGVDEQSNGELHVAPILYAVGGQHTLLLNGRGSNGIYLLYARRLSELLSGSWLPLLPGAASANSSLSSPSSLSTAPLAAVTETRLQPIPPALDVQPRHWLTDGRHPGCVERRGSEGTPCEYDGKLSLAYHRSRFLLFTRANLKTTGGRFVQVARSPAGADAPTSFSPFALLTIAGYEQDGPGNIYFATAKANPLDATGATLLGLFAVNLGKEGETNGIGKSFIGLSISCDGQFWAPFSVVVKTMGARSG